MPSKDFGRQRERARRGTRHRSWNNGFRTRPRIIQTRFTIGTLNVVAHTLQARIITRDANAIGKALSLLTKEASVFNMPKITGVIACTFLLCLGLANATQATERMHSAPCTGGQSDLVKCMEKTAKGIDTVTGEVLRIEDNDLVVRRFNGKEVRLHLDAHTQMTEMIGRGDRIEAIVDEVNNQGRALSIRQLAK